MLTTMLLIGGTAHAATWMISMECALLIACLLLDKLAVSSAAAYTLGMLPLLVLYALVEYAHTATSAKQLVEHNMHTNDE